MSKNHRPAECIPRFVTEEFTIINNAPAGGFDFTPSPATRRDKVKFVDISQQMTADRGVALGVQSGELQAMRRSQRYQRYAKKGEFPMSSSLSPNNGGLHRNRGKTIR